VGTRRQVAIASILGRSSINQGVYQRSVRYACGGRYVVVSKTFPAPLLEQERLVDDSGKRWLEQTLCGEIAFLTQFRIHGHL
jgi:hypothetical protein